MVVTKRFPKVIPQGRSNKRFPQSSVPQGGPPRGVPQVLSQKRGPQRGVPKSSPRGSPQNRVRKNGPARYLPSRGHTRGPRREYHGEYQLGHTKRGIPLVIPWDVPSGAYQQGRSKRNTKGAHRRKPWGATKWGTWRGSSNGSPQMGSVEVRPTREFPQAGTVKGVPEVSHKGGQQRWVPQGVQQGWCPKVRPQRGSPNGGAQSGVPRAGSPKGSPNGVSEVGSPGGPPGCSPRVHHSGLRQVVPQLESLQVEPHRSPPRGVPHGGSPRVLYPWGSLIAHTKLGPPKWIHQDGYSKGCTRRWDPKGSPQKMVPKGFTQVGSTNGGPPLGVHHGVQERPLVGPKRGPARVVLQGSPQRGPPKWVRGGHTKRLYRGV
jgi:hypothetical protein